MATTGQKTMRVIAIIALIILVPLYIVSAATWIFLLATIPIGLIIINILLKISTNIDTKPQSH